MAVTHNVDVDQGADWTLNLTYENPAGTPVVLTGYTAALQFRTASGAASAALTLTSPSSGITITAATGKLAVTATATQTRALAAGAYRYDLEITSSGGVVTRLVQGQALVSGEVTLV